MYKGFRRVLGALTVLLLGVFPSISPFQDWVQPAHASSEEIDRYFTFDGTDDVATGGFNLTSNTDFSIEMWLYFDGAADGSYGIFRYGDTSDSHKRRVFAYVERDADGNNELRVGINGSGSHYTTGYYLPGQEWVHFAIVREDSSNWRVDINGTEVFRQANSYWNIGGNPAPFRIGDQHPTGDHWKGRIDQVKIWDGALTSSEVQTSMRTWDDTGITGKSLLHHYDFNDISTTQVTDQQGTDHLSWSGSPAAGSFGDVKTATSSGLNTVVEFPRSYLTSTGGWTVPAGISAIDYLLVGGGGSGGSTSLGSAGGGGGGRVSEASSVSVTASTTVAVTVGSGGIPLQISGQTVARGSDGGSTSLSGTGLSVAALGGSAGANAWLYNPAPQATASTAGFTGGGGSSHAGTGSNGSTGVGGAAYKGGSAWADCCVANPQAGGGGGGAGGAGANATSGNAGAGGTGVSSSISGTATYYGGGGGGGKRTTSGAAGSGGQGGGGAGGKAGAGNAGGANTGGGGGGAGGDAAAYLGGFGGSGIVIIRFDLHPLIWIDASSDTGASTVLDASPNNYDATLQNSLAVTSGVFDFNNGTIQSDLTTGKHIKLQDTIPDTIDFSAGISVHVYADFGTTAETWERLIDFGSGNPQDNILFSRVGTTNDLTFQVYNGGSGASSPSCTASGVITSGMKLYSAVLDGTHCQIYIDGVAQIAGDGASFAVLPVSANRTLNYIGQTNWTQSGTPDKYLDGSIGSVRVFNSVQLPRSLQDALTISSSDLVAGATATLSSSGGSGDGEVSYTVESGNCTISGTTLTSTGSAGDICVIRGIKAATSTYFASTDVISIVTSPAEGEEILRFDATHPDSFTNGDSLWTDLQLGVTASRTASISFDETTKSFSGFGTSQQFTVGNIAKSFADGISVFAVVDFSEDDRYWERIIDFGTGQAQNNIIFSRYATEENLVIRTYAATGGSYWECRTTTGDAIEDGFHQYGVSLDEDGTCTFYRDGSTIAGPSSGISRTAGSPILPTATLTSNFIGQTNWSAYKDGGSDDEYFSGSIQSVVVYNTAVEQPTCYPIESTFTGNGTIGEASVPYKVLQFTTVGDCSWATPTGVTALDYLVVAGGGGGAGGQASTHGGGGGGAGGLLQGAASPSGTVTISVGPGGDGGATPSNSGYPGESGGDSSFGAITAIGGGGGGTYYNGGPSSGGSGGGGGVSATAASRTGADGTSGQGNSGGDVGLAGINANAAAGGGGAGASGQDAVDRDTGGAGGAGLSVTLAGVVTDYAGGGGGGGNVTAGAGGNGGGGAGGNYSSGAAGATGNAGHANTGGGGGGGTGTSGATAKPGGDGGSGVVIVRYSLGPGAPAISSVSSGDGSIDVAFTAPSHTGGAAITDYEYSFDGSTWRSLGTSSAGTQTISGLTNGTAYTVRLRAVNGNNGLSVSAGSAVTPQPDPVVTFISNYSGGAADEAQTLTYGQAAALSSNPFTRAGYMFAGWATNADGSGTTYDNEEAVTLTADLTLYAQWTNILINLDGASTDSLPNSATTWTSVYPGNSRATGTASGDATYFSQSGIRGFRFDDNADAVVFDAGVGALDGAMTLETWIKPGNLRANWNIIATRWFTDYSNGAATDWHFAIKPDSSDSNKLKLNLYTTNTDDKYGSYEFPATSADVWYHLAFTIGSDGTAQFYVNGETDGSSFSVSRTKNLNARLYLSDPRALAGFEGDMSLFRIYNTALSSSQIEAAFDQRKSSFGISSDIVFSPGNDSSGSNVSSSKAVDANFTVPSSIVSNGYFSRAGYSIVAWSTNADGSTIDYAFGDTYSTNADLTLYPVWSPNSLTVSWDSKGGSSVSDSSVNTGAYLSAPTAPTRTGYTFAGWSATNGGSAVSFSYAHPNTSDFTMYALWTAETYTVTWDSKGGTSVADGTVNYGANLSLPTEPTKSGYRFVGWSANDGGSAETFPYAHPNSADFTMYAVWVVDNYTVSFQAGDNGSGSNRSSTKIHGTALSLPDSETANGYFTRAGYGIVGWSENADGSTTDYALGGSYTANAGDTLYPVWELNSCVVNSGDTYVNSGGGSGAVFGSSSSMIFKNASSSTSNSYNRAGYLRFEYDPSITWDGATLQVTVNSSSQGNANSFYNGTNNFQVKVYATGAADWDESTLTFNSANASSADWGLNTGTFPWAIDNGTLLGTIDIPTSTSTIGVSYGLSNAALDSFLNADSDGEVTFFLVRSDTQSQPNLGFATKDQTTYSAPTLLPHPASCAYTITYNKGSASGAGGSDNTATKIQGTGLTLPNSTTANNSFTRTGYTVTGWATNADGTGTTYAFGATYTAERNQTLYPVWTPETYTVTYTYNGATGGNSTTSEQYTVDSTVVALPTPAKTGYTFAGWYAESGLTTLVGTGGASYTPAADATLYAKWSAATFTVVYDYSGATGGNTTTDDDFTTGSGSPITLPTPTRTGYTFGGWYSDAALTSSVGAAGASYSPSINLTVYAKWTADSRSVTYVGTNKTSGSVPTDAGSYIIGNSVVVKANSGGLVRTGYDFAGWTENSDGSGTVLEAGDTVAVQTSDITLYAKWTAATYTITYHANGGSGSLARATDTFTTGNSGVTLPGVGSLTKTGYDFGGWSTTPTGSALVGAYSTSQDRTLYAVWTIKSITYSYAKGSDGDGNSLSSFGFSASFPTGSVDDFGTSVTLSSSVDASIDADANGSVDHQFFGWSDGTTVYDAGDTYVLGETNPTFTAQWIKVFSVRYALAGGSFAGSDSATDSQCIGTDDTCTDGQIISLNSRPSRAGYTFLGWEDQSGTVKSAAAVTTITSSSYLFTAKWDPIDYTLNFNSLGGSNVISDYTQNIGDIVTIPDPGSKTGYSFGGWSDGSTLYGIGGTYTVGASGASFSAQWIPDVYTVTYDWQGGSSSTPDVSDSYTVGTGDMSLATASGSGYSRDGYTFSGWSTSVGGSAVSGFQPTADDVLYAVWADGNYTLSYDGQGGTVASGIGTVPRTTSVTLPTPVRSNFTFVGWYDAASGGNLLGAGGASFTPTSSQSLYARWVQDSLYGVDLATLETANTYTASNSTSTDTTISHSPSSSSARVQIPSGALPAGTVVTVRYFKDTERATDLISDENTYFFSLLVSWLYGSGTSATVPDTAEGKPITVTLTNSNIKAGAMVYQVIGETVTELARATVDGSVTVELTEDPEIVVAATKPSAPTSVSGTSGDTRVSVSWTAGSSGGSPITGYTVTASPGGATCSTASTSCTVNSLTNNTAYTFTVTAQNALGASTASTASSAVTPVGANYAVTFDANGGSSVSAGSFFSGSTVSAPSSPSRSGYTFEGWSTTLDDDTTKVTFPYAPGVTNAITLYALWEVAPVAPSRGNSGRVVTPPVRPSLPITPARPTITVPVVTPPPVLQAPVASPVAPSVLGGSSQAVVGGQSVATETTQRGNSGVGVKAGNVEVGIGVKTPSPNSRVQSNPASGNPELVVAAGEVATINGKGMLPGSTVQFWLPGADSRELGRVTVLPDGSINADVSLANSPAAPPLPIGRQVLQLTGYDEQGNLTVIDTVINIAQGAPAPERLRETDEVPDLQPGQTLATSAGAPETVTITANAETRQVSIESSEWSFTVTVPEANGTVNEIAPGAPTVQFLQASTAVVDGEGFQPGTRVDIFLFSDPTLLGSFTVAEDGSVSAEIYLDKRFATIGDHTLQIQGVGNDGYVKAANLGVLVEEPPMETTAHTALTFVWWIIAGVILAAVLLVVLVSRRRRLG